MDYFVIITVARSIPGGGMAQSTFKSTITCAAGATRQDIYQYVRSSLPPEWESAIVIFFSAEPNAAC